METTSIWGNIGVIYPEAWLSPCFAYFLRDFGFEVKAGGFFGDLKARGMGIECQSMGLYWGFIRVTLG